MLPQHRSLLKYLGAFGIVTALAGVILYQTGNTATSLLPGSQSLTAQDATRVQSAAAIVAIETSSSSTSSVTTSIPNTSNITPKINTSSSVVSLADPQSPTIAASTTVQAVRMQNPYDVAPESFSTVNTAARASLVNILCMPRGGGSLAPISGSGVIIDSRGVILTNAHVAQYVLLSEDSEVNLSCQIRIGAPATAAFTAEVLYIPPVWVTAHAAEINTPHPTGTGEHDYALLRITGTVSGQALPATFPYLPYDTREAIGFLGDQLLGASYPAEFLGGLAAENDLYPVSSVSAIDQLLTFATSTVDDISLGGVIEAQSGSSGGPVVNQWGYLIGLITTTSDATTTAARDLRAVTVSYINRDIETQTGSSLAAFLNGDLVSKESNFNDTIAPGLVRQYIQLLSK
jgi:hypothetical protein